MKKILVKLNAFLKGIILVLHPGIYLGWLRYPLLMTSNILSLTKWIAKQDKKDILNDFYCAKRNHSKRFTLYQYVADKLDLGKEAVDYLEFGVCQGHSLKWWISNCTNGSSKFYGFDTFEGLPENWGKFSKGDMAAKMPDIDDYRLELIKGLFQNTLPAFLLSHSMKNERRKVIHLDADLFSSTLYALTSMAPYLKNGDILFFDEFNVPNHEFYAFKIFCESYYIKTKLLGAVNNYFQVALMITN